MAAPPPISPKGSASSFRSRRRTRWPRSSQYRTACAARCAAPSLPLGGGVSRSAIRLPLGRGPDGWRRLVLGAARVVRRELVGLYLRERAADHLAQRRADGGALAGAQRGGERERRVRAAVEVAARARDRQQVRAAGGAAGRGRDRRSPRYDDPCRREGAGGGGSGARFPRALSFFYFPRALVFFSLVGSLLAEAGARA